MFLSSCELEKGTFLIHCCSLATSFSLTHTVSSSRSLVLFLTMSFKLAHSSQNPSSTWIPLLCSHLLAALLTLPPYPPSLALLLSSQLQWALGNVSGIFLTLQSLHRGSSHSFVLFPCHWLSGRIMHFRCVYSCLLITLLYTALKYCYMLRIVTTSICFPRNLIHWRHAELRAGIVTQ